MYLLVSSFIINIYFGAFSFDSPTKNKWTCTTSFGRWPCSTVEKGPWIRSPLFEIMQGKQGWTNSVKSRLNSPPKTFFCPELCCIYPFVTAISTMHAQNLFQDHFLCLPQNRNGIYFPINSFATLLQSWEWWVSTLQLSYLFQGGSLTTMCRGYDTRLKNAMFQKLALSVLYPSAHRVRISAKTFFYPPICSIPKS